LQILGKQFGLELVRVDYPWKLVPVSLIAYQASRIFGFNPRYASGGALSKLGIPLNLFDAMRVVFRKS
jgi:hypothetical protein